MWNILKKPVVVGVCLLSVWACKPKNQTQIQDDVSRTSTVTTSIVNASEPIEVQTVSAPEALPVPLPTNLEGLLSTYAHAKAQEVIDDQALADIAERLAFADYTESPFNRMELRDIRADIAQTLSAAGRHGAAVQILKEITEEAAAELWPVYDEATDTIAPAPQAGYATYMMAVQFEHMKALAHAQMAFGDPDSARRSFEIAVSTMPDTSGENYTEQLVLKAHILKASKAAQALGTEVYGIECIEKDLRNQLRGNNKDIVEAIIGPPAPDLDEVEISCPYGAPVAASSELAEFDSLTVFYGTNRNKLNPLKKVEKAYGAKRGAYAVGSIEMTIPKNREPGTLQIPGLLHWGAAKDGVHIVLSSIKPIERETEFSRDLASWVAQSDKPIKEAFIYVHGHGVSFANAARRTAQLAIDLDMPHGGMFYAWPASSSVIGYQASQNNVEPSVAHLTRFLKTVRAGSGAQKIHLIAHSMGNRVLSLALQDMQREGWNVEPAQKPLFGQAIWAAPDVDSEVFAARMTNIDSMVDGMTIYASQKDRALGLSKFLGGGDYPRAGQAPPEAVIASRVPTVDTTGLSRPRADFIAHTDYASHAIDDMRAVLWLSLAPDSRCTLTRRVVNAQAYWVAGAPQTASACDKTTFRTALSMARLKRQGGGDLNDLSSPIYALQQSVSADVWAAAETISQNFEPERTAN